MKSANKKIISSFVFATVLTALAINSPASLVIARPLTSPITSTPIVITPPISSIVVPPRNRPPVLVTTIIPSAFVNRYYSATVVIEDKDGQQVSQASISNLPKGLRSICTANLNNQAICTLSGTPVIAGTSQLKVFAKDSLGATLSTTLQLTIQKSSRYLNR